MPLLTLSTWPALTQPEQRHAIARELTGHTERLLGKKRALTAVAVLAEPIGWTIGGEPVEPVEPPGSRTETEAGPARSTFALEIRITAGTNTAQQKADWIAAAWDTLRRALPEALVEASYVSVLELPADDWGWGGRTQAARLPR